VIACSGQLRLAGMGDVIGIDMTAAMALAKALGYDAKEMAELLPWAEQGIMKAFTKDK